MRGIARKIDGTWSVRSIVKSKEVPTLDIIQEYMLQEQDQLFLNKKLGNKNSVEIEYDTVDKSKDNTLFKFAVLKSILA